jgi:hypothetical protein
VFDGEYIAQISTDYLADLERARNDATKGKRERGGASIDLSNSV